MGPKGAILSIILSIAILTTGSAAVTADFSANPTSGGSPLSVKFTDTSAGSPAGWTWYFGDEDYSGRWRMMTSGAGWSARDGQCSVALPDGSVVLMGGGNKNDVWRSTDNGATWTAINPNAPWSARSEFACVVMPDSSIVIVGGGYKQDVWRSQDKGKSWTRMTDKAAWPARERHSAVSLPDNSIVLIGGSDKNDVWRSTDYGATWIQLTAKAEWAGRSRLNSLALPDGSILLMGGYANGDKNDVWKSTDKGETWTLVTNSAAWTARERFSSNVMPDGSIVLMGGGTLSGRGDPFWRSTDSGETWTKIDVSNSWVSRTSQSSVALPDGSLILMGGTDSHGNAKNDVWRLMTAGSNEQNPTHVYTSGGNFPVTLLANNAEGYNTLTKSGYISVSGSSGGSKTITGNSSTTTGSPSGSGGSTPAKSADSPLPLVGAGIIVLLVIGGTVFYFLKSRTNSAPPGSRTNYTVTPETRTTTVCRTTSAPAKGSHHEVFISYANRDKPIADAICNYLESRKVRCWIAPRDITPGVQYQEAIIDAIDSSYIMVLVFSADSNESPHVLTEVTEAMSNKVTIIPFKVEDVQPSKSMKYLINVPHWLDAVNPPMMDHIQKLGETIHVLLDRR